MDKIIDAAKEKLNELVDGVSNSFKTEVLASIKEYSLDKLKDTWTQIENSSEIFQQTGYSITAIDINLAIPPTIILSFDQIENISDEDEEKLLAANKSKPILYSILIALFKANAIQQSINSAQYKFSGLTIELGLSPKIDMKFKRLV